MEINGILQNEAAQRISDYIKFSAATTPSKFAVKAGLDVSGFHKMLKGQQTITPATLKKISEAHGLSMDWLLTGEGPMMIERNAPAPGINYTEGVPYYNEDFMLGFEEIGAPDSENPDFLIRMPGYERATLWCNASGHSMEPEINNGDIIALQRVEDFSFLPFGDVYGFITANGMRTIKRLGRSERDGFYRLIPTNKEYDEQEIPINIITHVYRVMGTMKAF